MKKTLLYKDTGHGYMSGKRDGPHVVSSFIVVSMAYTSSYCFMYTTEHGHSILAYRHIHESLLYTFCLYCVSSYSCVSRLELLYPEFGEDERHVCLYTWEMHSLSAEFLSRQDRWWCIAGPIQRTYGYVLDA